MKRFITYLYSYEQGIKGRNVGFIKTDIRNEQIQMELHVKGMGRYQGNAKIYILVKNAEEKPANGILVGTLAMNQGNLTGKIAFSTPQAGMSYNNIIGVAIKCGNMYYAASSWVDDACEELQSGRFDSYDVDPVGEREEKEIEPEPEPKPSPDKTQIKDRSVTKEKTDIDNKREKIHLEKEEFQKDSQVHILQCPEEEKNVQDMGKGEEHKEKTGDCAVQIQRIDIHAIHKLPKRNWYLCNNSFLIHGYFNYHYLIIKKVRKNGTEKLYLGVPGIYERPERVMAMLFGFPVFQNEKQASEHDITDIAVERQAEPEEGTFGFWFCLLDT